MISSPFARNLSNLWLVWHNAKDSNKSPSALIGLTEGSYEAYCYDQAAWYVVTTITAEVEKVGQKPVKGQAQKEAARTRKLQQLLGQAESTKGYADPAALFSKS